MKNILSNILKMTVTMALVACAGQSSDPLKDYEAVKRVPLHQEKSDTNTIEVPLIKIQIVGASEENYGNFVVNQKGTVDIKAVQLSEKNLAEIVGMRIQNFKGADQPTAQRISKDTLRITWTPKASAITGNDNSIRKNFQVVVDYKSFGKLTTQTENLVFTVDRNVQSPQIIGTSGLKGITAIEGQEIPFTITVKDPNYYGQGTPELTFPKHMNTNVEAFMADASVYESQNMKIKTNPVYNGNNTFTFFHVLKLDKLPHHYDRKGKLDQNAVSVKLCLNARAISVVQRISGLVQECFNAKYSAQPAEVKFASDNRKLEAGQENVIEFTLSTFNSLSAISLTNSEKQIANLSGEKTLECISENENNTRLACKLKWTPSCDPKKNTSKYTKLNLEINSKLNKISKKSNIEEQFEISTVACEAKAKADAAEKAAAEEKAKQEKAAAEAAKKAAEADAKNKKAETKS